MKRYYVKVDDNKAIGVAMGALKEDIFNLHGYKLLLLCFLMKIKMKSGIFII